MAYLRRFPAPLVVVVAAMAVGLIVALSMVIGSVPVAGDALNLAQFDGSGQGVELDNGQTFLFHTPEPLIPAGDDVQIMGAMYGLTEREFLGAQLTPNQSFLERLQANDTEALPLPSARPDLRSYVHAALWGGFPGLVLENDDEMRGIWINSYLDQLLTRDSHVLTATRDQYKLDRYFEAVAASSAGTPQHKTLYDAAGINRVTAHIYDELLSKLFVAEAIPAWSSNRLDRLVMTPKRYVVDGALIAAALDATVETVMADGDLLGRVIDTFVMAQLRPEIALPSSRLRVHHLRTKGGRQEVDVLIELPGGKLIALEVKASAAPKSADAKHLRWLKDRFPDRFVIGAVLHTGPDVFRLDDKILAVPISAFWG